MAVRRGCELMTRRRLVAALLTSVAFCACGGAACAAEAPAARPATAVQPSAAPVSRSPAATAGATFTGTIDRTPGALVRFGPGLDMPVMDVAAAGRGEVFDARSGPWFHLADGRGWVSSASVSGVAPSGMSQTAWTRPDTIPAATAGLLDVPLHLQEQRATCEVAALKMALGFTGIAVDERALLGFTGIDSRPPEVDGSGSIARWGDPDQAFVGDPGGDPPNHTGYGVYAAPIARAAALAGGAVSASGTGIAPAAVYAAVVGGHPAVTWVTNDYRPGSVATWRAWDGAQVTYSLREHAVLVIGATPTQVLVNDPWWGQRWHSRSEFEGAYRTFGDMAVIVG